MGWATIDPPGVRGDGTETEDIPRLLADGTVLLATPAEVEAARLWLARGALRVRPEVPPPPLVELAVRLRGGPLGDGATLRCQAVTRYGDSAILELLESAADVLDRLTAPPATPPEATADAPAPPAVEASLRPILEKDTLRFLSPAELDAAVPDLGSVGAVLAILAGRARTGPRSLAVQIGAYVHPVALPATVHESAAGVVVQLDRAALRAELPRLVDAAARLATGTPGPAFAVGLSTPGPGHALGLRTPGPAAGERPGAARAPRPGFLSRSVLAFEAAEDLLAEAADLEQAGALAVRYDAPPPLHETLALALELGGVHAGEVTATCVHLGAGFAGLVLADRLDAARLLARARELLAPRRARPTPAPSVPVSGTLPPFEDPSSATPGPAAGRLPRLALPRAGALLNPTDARGLLALAPDRPVPEGATPSAPLLLRWLYGLPGLQRVTVSLGRGRPQTLTVLQGTELRAAIAPEALCRLLAEPEGTYEVFEAAEVHHGALGRATIRTRRLLVEVLKQLVRRPSEADLAAALGPNAARCPALDDQGRALLPSLALTPPQQRAAWRLLDGRTRLDEVIRSGVGARAAWELVYLLELHGGLSWREPPERPAAPAEDPVERRARELEALDHFAALGAHFSAAPRRLEAAIRELRVRWGPSAPERARSPEAADRILARLEEAWTKLSTSSARGLYRRERWPDLKWAYQAELLVQKARLLAVRGELAEARDLLEGAQDMHATPEAGEELRRVLELERRAAR